MARPSGVIPEWASNASYPAGSDPWALQPTKQDPGSSAVAAGFLPNARLDAETINWLLHAYWQWIAYQDRAEGRTWLEQNEPGIRSDAPGNVILWNPTQWRYFMGGTLDSDQFTPIVYYSVNGTDWLDDSAPTDSLSDPGRYQIVDGPSDGTILGWINAGTGCHCHIRAPNGTWGADLGSPSIQNQAAVYAAGVWVLGGTAGGPHPGVHLLTTGGVFTAVTLPGASGVADSITLMATDGTRVVAIAGDDVWTCATPAGAWTHVGTPFASTPAGLCRTPNRFWVTCEGGEVYVSSDGSTWNLASTQSWAFVDGLTALGGLVFGMASVTRPVGVQPMIALGWNAGQNWELVVPPWEAPNPAGHAALTLATVEGRVAFVRVNGVTSSDGTRLSYSLRVKP